MELSSMHTNRSNEIWRDLRGGQLLLGKFSIVMGIFLGVSKSITTIVEEQWFEYLKPLLVLTFHELCYTLTVTVLLSKTATYIKPCSVSSRAK